MTGGTIIKSRAISLLLLSELVCPEAEPTFIVVGVGSKLELEELELEELEELQLFM